MRNHNVLITNVSITRKNAYFEYIDEAGNRFDGQMTNEAPIKSLIKRLSSKGEKLDEIIFIESDSVRQKSLDENVAQVSHAKRLNALLDVYLKSENLSEIRRNVVEISDEPDEQDVSKAVFHVYDILLDIVQKNENVNIYIESNGGVRYVLTMLLSVTKTLEKCYEGVHICEISSMVFNQKSGNEQSKLIPIVNTKRIYDSAQITEIVNEFLVYGRTNLLCEYVKQNMNYIDPEQIQDVDSLIDKFVNTSNDILLCRSAMMLEDFYGEGNLSSRISSFLQKYDQNEDYFSSVFSHIIRIIQNELHKNLYEENVEQQELILYLPNIIKWCLKKDFLQQALTLTVECLPEYLFATGILSFSNTMKARMANEKTGKYDESYYFMAHINEYLPIVENVFSTSILEALREKMNSSEAIFTQEDWKEILKKYQSDISDIQIRDEDRKYAESIFSFIRDINNVENLSNITKEEVKAYLSQNGLCEELADSKCAISLKYSAPFYNVLRGEKIMDGEIVEATNIANKKDRLIKTVSFLVKERPQSVQEDSFENVIDLLFYDNRKLGDSIYNYSGKTLIPKFHIRNFMEAKQLLSTRNIEAVQDIFYAFAICKEQRNFSNHGHVLGEEKEIAMRANEIKTLIGRTLDLCV
ncbi:MAG: TM1812 family CRISPR-associated protein [Lachnospiraceae bacterium]|nr:TM1812 family CRISPR-associated protein [Lachnospiraceae bacterium]